jgi:hypothetical protein
MHPYLYHQSPSSYSLSPFPIPPSRSDPNHSDALRSSSALPQWVGRTQGCRRERAPLRNGRPRKRHLGVFPQRRRDGQPRERQPKWAPRRVAAQVRLCGWAPGRATTHESAGVASSLSQSRWAPRSIVFLFSYIFVKFFRFVDKCFSKNFPKFLFPNLTFDKSFCFYKNFWKTLYPIFVPDFSLKIFPGFLFPNLTFGKSFCFYKNFWKTLYPIFVLDL